MRIAKTLVGVHTHTHTHTRNLIKINMSYTLTKSAVVLANKNIDNNVKDSFRKCA